MALAEIFSYAVSLLGSIKRGLSPIYSQRLEATPKAFED